MHADSSSTKPLSRRDIESGQFDRLREMLRELQKRNAFWTRKWAESGIDALAIRNREDFQKLPFVSKQEFVIDREAHPPYGSNLTYPLSSYSRMHQTSGTTARPLCWFDTPASWDWFMHCWQEIYSLVGLTPSDRLVFPFSFGPFIGFWAAFEGASRRGNLCLPTGGMSSEARLRFLLEHAATVVCCTPTYALRLAEIAQSQQLDLAASPVRLLIVAGEPGGNVSAIRDKLQKDWGARVIDHWGMTDVGSLGIETAPRPGGLLILERECIAEIIDRQSGQPASPGEIGELVITNLGRWGQPVIRYRTGDLVKAPLSGATEMLWLEGGILGRVDDMFFIRGNNVFPSAIEDALALIPGIAEFRIRVESRRSMDHLHLEIEPTSKVASNSTQRQHLIESIQSEIKDRFNFQAEVTLVDSGSLPRSELKSRRILRV